MRQSSAYGPSIRQSAYSVLFALRIKYLGDQSSVGDWEGMIAAAAVALPRAIAHIAPRGAEPPQNLKEFDPEWARAFLSGTATINCDHAQMLRQVKVPVLFTHYFRKMDPADGTLIGAVSDLQVDQARRLIEAAGQRFEYHSYPEAGHFLHAENPALYADTVLAWTKTLGLSQP